MLQGKKQDPTTGWDCAMKIKKSTQPKGLIPQECPEEEYMVACTRVRSSGLFALFRLVGADPTPIPLLITVPLVLEGDLAGSVVSLPVDDQSFVVLT